MQIFLPARFVLNHILVAYQLHLVLKVSTLLKHHEFEKKDAPSYLANLDYNGDMRSLENISKAYAYILDHVDNVETEIDKNVSFCKKW
jgi:hypothetical protein